LLVALETITEGVTQPLNAHRTLRYKIRWPAVPSTRQFSSSFGLSVFRFPFAQRFSFFLLHLSLADCSHGCQIRSISWTCSRSRHFHCGSVWPRQDHSLLVSTSRPSVTHSLPESLNLLIAPHIRDCCKPSCAWSGKADVLQPVQTCDSGGNKLTDPNVASGCGGGQGFTCVDNQPWAIDDNLAYGFAAVHLTGSNEAQWCCQCYELTYVQKVDICLYTKPRLADIGSRAVPLLARSWSCR